MANDGREPWDARLIERMSRGSDKAETRRWTPRQWTYYGLIWIVGGIVSRDPYWYGLAGAVFLIAIVVRLRDLRRTR
jgi:hypothetical protein